MDWKTIDRHCLIAAILFILSDIIALFGFIAVAVDGPPFESIDQVYELDPSRIQAQWDFTAKYNRTTISYEIINAFAWFVFSIPSTLDCIYICNRSTPCAFMLTIFPPYFPMYISIY
jgi:hypothetical protein